MIILWIHTNLVVLRVFQNRCAPIWIHHLCNIPFSLTVHWLSKQDIAAILDSSLSSTPPQTPVTKAWQVCTHKPQISLNPCLSPTQEATLLVRSDWEHRLRSRHAWTSINKCIKKIYMYVYTHTRAYTHIHMFMCIYMHIFILYIWICMWMYIRMFIFIYVFIDICRCLSNVHIYVCI